MPHILLVDDDQLVLVVIKDMLLMKDYKVTAVQEGSKALKLLAADNRFDLVLTDLRMSDVDGLQIAKATKAQSPKTPVILYTGYAADCEGKDLALYGVDLCLTKPLTMAILFAGIEGLLNEGLS